MSQALQNILYCAENAKSYTVSRANQKLQTKYRFRDASATVEAKASYRYVQN